MDDAFKERIEGAKDILRKDNFSISYDELDEALSIIGELSEKVKSLENPLRPIDTAPKDGTRILACDENSNFEVVQYMERYGTWHTLEGSWLKATHWTHLPKLGGV